MDCSQEAQGFTVADVFQTFGGSGLLSTIELLAFAVELKGFNGVNEWPAQRFIDQAAPSKGARLKPEYQDMALGALLELVHDDLVASPDSQAWLT
jgi:hypothetical protein